MISANIPYLYNRNGIYYYRTRTKWLSLKTRCKTKVFQSLCIIISSAMSYTESSKEILVSDTATIYSFQKPPNTKKLITEYLKENGHRWSSREYTRVNSSLQFLSESSITKDDVVQLKKSLLTSKTVTTFNRYIKYYNAFYRWDIANNSKITINPFTGLKIIEKKAAVSSQRNASS